MLGYEAFYRSHYKEVFFIAYNMTNDYFLAEDIIQEAFVKIFLKFPTLKNNESLRTWVYKIVKTTAIDHLRKHEKWKNTINLDNYINECDIQDKITTEEIVEKKWIWHKLYNTITYLDDQFKEVIILKYLYEFNLNEISELTGVSIGTVKSRLNRARLKLERKLSI